MNDYKSLRKKNSTRTLAVVMVLLIALEMCSLAVLFSQIVTYSTGSRSYVISLMDGAERTKAARVDTAQTGFIVPTSVVDPDTLIESTDSVNTLDFGFSTSDTDQVWTTDTHIDVFHLSYNETGEITVLSDGTGSVPERFAPGTGSTYSFTVSNTGPHDLDYLVYIEASTDAKDANGQQLWIPLTGRLRKGDGTYLVGSADNWPDYTDLNESGDLSSLNAGSSMEYLVDWEWPFERTDGEGLDANDAYDTMLGNLAVGDELKASIRIKTVAWWEDYWHATADVISGDDSGTASVTPDKVLQGSDDTFTLTATPADGYQFDGWTFDDGDVYEIIGGGTTSDPTLTIKPGSDIHAHASFSLIPTEPPVPGYWTITANVIEGEGTATPSVDQVQQNNDEEVTLTATPADGYQFEGWTFDDGDVYEIIGGGTTSDPTLTIKPGSDIHAHASFSLIPTEPPVPAYWTITADVIEGDGTATPSVDQVQQNNNEEVTLTATPADGYQFDGWTFDDGDVYEIIGGGTTSDPTLTIKPGSDIHAHASFSLTPVPGTWTITADVIEGEGTATPSVDHVQQNNNEEVTLTATPADGYEFDGWTFDDGDVYEIIGGGTTSDPTLTIKPGSDIHAHATFRLKATEAPSTPATEPTIAPTVAPTAAPTVEPTTPSNQPKTGDSTRTLLWLVISILAFVALVVVFFFYLKARKREKAYDGKHGKG